MQMLGQKIICPFCFEAFSPQDIQFRCLNPSCTKQEQDQKYADMRNLPVAPMGHVISVKKRAFGGGVPHTVDCDVCKRQSRTRLCPGCHFELSHDVGQIDQRVIAIIGGSNTGKSHYIAALIHHLQHKVGENFQFSVSMVGDGTRERWNRDFYTPLFQKGSVLTGTQRSTSDATVKNPLMFRLTLKQGGHIRALNISFFDTAGEDMSKLKVDELTTEARYICNADGLIVLLDPLQIESVRQRLLAQNPDLDVPVPDNMARPEFIVERLRELFEGYYHLSGSKKIPIPVAFTFSKVDTLWPLVAPDSALHHPGEHFGVVDMPDVQSVSTEIGGYMQSWISSSFYNDIQYKFAKFHFFGISSLGKPPDKDRHIDVVEPLRVEDPFLWLLYQFKLVQGKKGR